VTVAGYLWSAGEILRKNYLNITMSAHHGNYFINYLFDPISNKGINFKSLGGWGKVALKQRNTGDSLAILEYKNEVLVNQL